MPVHLGAIAVSLAIMAGPALPISSAFMPATSSSYASRISEEDMTYRITVEGDRQPTYEVPDESAITDRYLDSETYFVLGGWYDGYWAGEEFTGQDGQQWRAFYSLSGSGGWPEFSYLPASAIDTAMLASEKEAQEEAEQEAYDAKWDEYYAQFDGEGDVVGGTTLYKEPSLDSKALGATEWPGLKEWNISSVFEKGDQQWRKIEQPDTDMGVVYVPADSVENWISDEPAEVEEPTNDPAAGAVDEMPVAEPLELPDALTAVPDREFPIPTEAVVLLGGLVVLTAGGLTTYHLISKKRKGSEAK